MNRLLAFRNDWSGRGPLGSDIIGGTGYYRITKPVQFLRDKYDVFEFGDLFVTNEKLKKVGKDWPLEEMVPNLIKDSDIVLMKNISHPGGLSWFAGGADYYNKPLILDMDDDYFAVDDLNPNRKYFKETEITQITHKILFESATAMIVATEPLAEVYKPYCKNIHVIPNYNDVEDWKFTKGKRSDGRIVIGWAGSLTHESDFTVVSDALMEIWKKYGKKVIFSFCGAWPETMMTRFPKGSFIVQSGTRSMLDFPQALALWGFDIGIAPIKQSAFNDSKSHTKWIEYAMYKIPTVASNFGPYKRTLVDGYSGLLAETTDEWVDKISRLVDDAALRQQIGQNAYDVAVKDWQWRDHAWRWGEVLDRYIGKGFRHDG